MVKKRVHELAKELNIESREIIKNLKQMGINVKSHMSTLEDSEVKKLVQLHKKSAPAGEKSISDKPQPAAEQKQSAMPGKDTEHGSTAPGTKETAPGETKKSEKGRAAQSGTKRESHGARAVF
jgi:translation initiation factor IF-2